VKALLRRPGPRLAEGIVTHIERRPVDLARAYRQWVRYADALRSAGWETVEVPPADDCPDGVFIEDLLVVYENVAILARPGAVERRPELSGVEDVVSALGYAVERIAAPGTLDGGDVLRIGQSVYVSAGSRTNAAGIDQLRAVLEPRGAIVVTIPIANVLHLKSVVTALPDGSTLGYLPNLDDPGLFPRLIGTPEESGAHVVLLGHGKLLLAADCPRSAELLAGLGYELVLVDVSEFQKLEGCVTCLSVLLDR
jgi:dimethylargininase